LSDSHFTGPKSPGLIILEHELSNQSVKAFIDAYPVMKANGWNITSTAELAGNLPYQNADSSTAPVTPANGVIVGDINSSEAPVQALRRQRIYLSLTRLISHCSSLTQRARKYRNQR
jgi:hypothetical protein